MSVQTKHYILMKNQKREWNTHMVIKRECGFHMKPRNKVKYDGIVVNRLCVHNYVLIRDLLKRKIKLKLNMYLNYLMTYLEEGGEDGTTDLRHALNDLTRYKAIVKGKYQKYLEEKYSKLLLKKIAVLESEIEKKMMYVEMQRQYDAYYREYEKYAFYQEEKEETKGKAR